MITIEYAAYFVRQIPANDHHSARLRSELPETLAGSSGTIILPPLVRVCLTTHPENFTSFCLLRFRAGLIPPIISFGLLCV